jgi:hypothetical protein
MDVRATSTRRTLMTAIAALLVFIVALVCVLVLKGEHTQAPGTASTSPPSVEVVAERSTGVVEAPEAAESVRDVAPSVGQLENALSVTWAGPADYVVRGRVVDSKRNPVPGAEVWLACTSYAVSDPSAETDLGLGGWVDPPWRRSKTDSKGRFEFRRQGERGKLEIQVRHEVHGVGAREKMGSDVAGAVVDFGDLELAPVLELRGRVLRHWSGESTTTAEPFEGVEVELQFEGGSPLRGPKFGLLRPEERRVRTASDGTFVFSRLPPGAYRVVARVDLFGDPLVVRESTATVVGAKIQRSTPTRTGPMPSARTFVPSSDPPATIFVARRAVLRGRVVLPDGSAVYGADVDVNTPTGETRVRTDPDGRFEVPGLARAPLALKVWRPKAATGVLRLTRIDGVVPGTREVQIVLAAAAELTGLVVDAEGKPQAAALVVAISATREELDIVHTDEEGRFLLRVPAHEAVDVEAGPSKSSSAPLASEGAGVLRARASRVRAGVSDLVLRLERK